MMMVSFSHLLHPLTTPLHHGYDVDARIQLAVSMSLHTQPANQYKEADRSITSRLGRIPAKRSGGSTTLIVLSDEYESMSVRLVWGVYQSREPSRYEE
jgi:hypothetical protein